MHILIYYCKVNTKSIDFFILKTTFTIFKYFIYFLYLKNSNFYKDKI